MADGTMADDMCTSSPTLTPATTLPSPTTSLASSSRRSSEATIGYNDEPSIEAPECGITPLRKPLFAGASGIVEPPLVN